jgi:hypothetical protein
MAKEHPQGTVTVPAAAKRLGMSAPALRRAIRNGAVPFHPVRIGEFLRIPTVEVEAVVSGLDVAGARAYLESSLPEGEPVELDGEALDRAAAVLTRSRSEK